MFWLYDLCDSPITSRTGCMVPIRLIWTQEHKHLGLSKTGGYPRKIFLLKSPVASKVCAPAWMGKGLPSAPKRWREDTRIRCLVINQYFPTMGCPYLGFGGKRFSDAMGFKMGLSKGIWRLQSSSDHGCDFLTYSQGISLVPSYLLSWQCLTLHTLGGLSFWPLAASYVTFTPTFPSPWDTKTWEMRGQTIQLPNINFWKKKTLFFPQQQNGYPKIGVKRRSTLKFLVWDIGWSPTWEGCAASKPPSPAWAPQEHTACCPACPACSSPATWKPMQRQALMAKRRNPPRLHTLLEVDGVAGSAAHDELPVHKEACSSISNFPCL